MIVGTVVLSLGASFGLSDAAVAAHPGPAAALDGHRHGGDHPAGGGIDYNLLLVARFKEEIHAGLNTGIIRSMAGSGSVVTSAGLVFAFTMGSMAISPLRVGEPGGHHDRAGPAVRHAGGAFVHDPVHRCTDGEVVLVACNGCASARFLSRGSSPSPDSVSAQPDSDPTDRMTVTSGRPDST